MTERGRQLRLIAFLLLSAGVIGVVVSCQAPPPAAEVAAFNRLPQVEHERHTADIGHRMKGPDRTNKGAKVMSNTPNT